MSYIGLDIGITGTKAVVFSIDGKILAKSYCDYGDEYKRNLRLKGEQDPIHILGGVKKVLRECNTLKLKDEPKTIAVSVSGDDLFPADRNGKPLFNVIAGLG
jgi:sugar (pentulose or hexulose) kinase